ncbi:MAG: hypothetical protein AB7U85_01780 [Alphaproteobacteria bacterium]
MTSINSLSYEQSLTALSQAKYSQMASQEEKSEKSSETKDSFGPAFEVSLSQNAMAVTAMGNSGEANNSLTEDEQEIVDEIFAKYTEGSDEPLSEETMAKIQEELEANGIDMPAPPPPPPPPAGGSQQDVSSLTDDEQEIIDEIFAKYTEGSDEPLSEETMAKIQEELEANGIDMPAPPPPPPPPAEGMSSTEDDTASTATASSTSSVESLALELLSSDDDDEESSVISSLLSQNEDEENSTSSLSAELLSSII